MPSASRPPDTEGFAWEKEVNEVVDNPGAVDTELVEVLPALHQRCPGSILKGRNAETKRALRVLVF
jgi:hypothetical protein